MKKIILITVLFFLLIPTTMLTATSSVDKNYEAKSIILNVPINKFTGGQVTDSLLGKYFETWYDFMLGSVGIIATIIIMWGGFKWLSSRGDAKQISDAKDTIFSAIAGLILAFGSYLIISLINPDLTKIKMPEITAIKVTSNYGVISQEYIDTVGEYEHEGRTGGTTPVNSSGATTKTLAIINAIKSETESSPTSVFRPHDTGSRHANGTAVDFPRNQQTNQYFINIIKNKNPDFHFKGQPGYILNNLNIGGTTYPTIRIINEYKPSYNCWHIDQG